tara:strand:- start:745 stop:1356 length:612 start_codon:yes stop_codon:yes gene_type:complete
MFIFLGFGFLFILSLNIWILVSTSEQIFIEEVWPPAQRVGLVLGTSRFSTKGTKNEFFEERMNAAAKLFELGIIGHILVSGDNRSIYYNEPLDMLNALKERGIPESAVTLDYAGLRTLDSVVRCAQIFGQSNFIIITQEFHLYRALFIANYYELKVYGFSPKSARVSVPTKVRVRELIARVLAVLDLYVWNKKPEIMGKLSPI